MRLMLGQSGHRALEGMRVRIAHARHYKSSDRLDALSGRIDAARAGRRYARIGDESRFGPKKVGVVFDHVSRASQVANVLTARTRSVRR
jgi:hypothetical protein